MILCNGSDVAVEKPDLSFSWKKTDLGKGFYLTPLKEQAVRWAERFKGEESNGIVSSYGFLERIRTCSHSRLIKVCK